MDKERIRQLIALARKRKVGELEITEGPARVSFKLKGAGSEVPPGPEPDGRADAVPEAHDTSDEHWIRSPMVGLFRSEDGAAREGTRVAAGDVVGHVESMGILNEIASEVSGVVTTIMVEDGDPVEYGQAILSVRTGDDTPKEESP